MKVKCKCGQEVEKKTILDLNDAEKEIWITCPQCKETYYIFLNIS